MVFRTFRRLSFIWIAQQMIFWDLPKKLEFLWDFQKILFFFHLVLGYAWITKSGSDSKLCWKDFWSFWQFSGTFLHLNLPKNDFLETPQKTRISVKISENSLFFTPGFESPEVEISEGSVRRCSRNSTSIQKFQLLVTQNQGEKKWNFWKFHRNSCFLGSLQKIIFGRFKWREASEKCENPSNFAFFW